MEPGGKVLVVHNSRSRRGRSAAEALRRALGRSGLSSTVLWREVGDPARGDLGGDPAADPPGRAIAVGGDGTVNAVAEWILRSGRATELAIVPGGTGNNLAGGLGIPRRPDRAAELALLGREARRVDAIRYRSLDAAGSPGSGEAQEPRIMIQGAAWGFPAAVSRRYEELRQGRLFRICAYPLGGLVYRLLALWALRAKSGRGGPALEGMPLRLDLPGERLEMEVIAAFAGNEPTLGGGFRPCPRAAVDDGLLDLCLVRAGGPDPPLRLLRSVAAGRHLGLDAVEYRRSPGPVELHFGGGAPMMADGDIWLSARSYRLEVLPGALRVVTGR